MKTIPLEYSKFYHIYNRGINGCKLFQENENYKYFLYLYDKYISTVADTFAWVLMRNHFHLLIRIKIEENIPFMYQTPEGQKDTSGLESNLSASDRPESVKKKQYDANKMKTIPLEYAKFYHIYNRGINGCNLFPENENYEHFLHLYDKYMSPVAETYAWVLMKNHFHLLVRIKIEENIPFMYQTPEGQKDTSGLESNLSASDRPESVSIISNISKKYKPANQFSHLFNAYTKAINKRYQRTGSLFEHSFRRIKVKSENHLRYLAYYIHHNPIHHGFCEHYLDYPWSSYLTILSPKATKLSRTEVLRWFNDKSNFKKYHTKEQIEKFNELRIDFINDY